METFISNLQFTVIFYRRIIRGEENVQNLDSSSLDLIEVVGKDDIDRGGYRRIT